MRQIKVKFWNGKKMSAPYELLDMLYEGVPQEIADIEGGLNTDPKFLSKIVTLEFTGLLDKNGKEIYEGDIINFIFDDGVIRCRVHWDDFHAGFKALPEDYENYGISQDMNASRPYEVIGNIHQNPELLEGE